MRIVVEMVLDSVVVTLDFGRDLDCMSNSDNASL